MRKSSLVVASLAALAGLLLSSCTFLGFGKVNLKVSVSGEGAPRRVEAARDVSPRAVTDNPGSIISFTPDSLQIRIRWVIIAEEMTYDVDAGGLTSGNTAQADLLPEPTVLTLERGESMVDVLDDTVNLPVGSPAQYGGILLCYGEEDETCTVLVNGSFSLENQTYTVTDLEVPFNTTGIGLNMPTVVDTSAGGVPVVRIIFDLDDCVQVRKTAEPPVAPNYVLVPGTDDLYMTLSSLVFVPYVGEAAPTVRKYAVDLTDDSYAPDQWYLKVITYFDGEAMAGAGYQMVMKPGATQEIIPFDPGMLYFPDLAENQDGTWAIDYAVYEGSPEAWVSFAAFDLDGGTGTLVHRTDAGDVELEYVSTELLP